MAATAVVGSFSFALVLVMRVAGLLAPVDNGLASGYVVQGFGLDGSGVQPAWAWPLEALLVFAVVWLMFETPGAGRRVMMLLTALVLMLALSPVLALWGVFWSPAAAGLGTAWGGACALLWTRQHPMPCELPEEQELRGGKIIPMNGTEQKEDQAADKQRSGNPPAKGGKKPRQRRK